MVYSKRITPTNKDILPMTKIKVIIADDHLLFQQGLQLILESETSFLFEVIGTANSGKELVNLLKTIRPNLIFLDLNMPNMDGYESLKYIKEWKNEAKIIVLTMYDDPKMVKKVLDEGVDAYILKKFGKEEIMKAVGEVRQDKNYVGKGIMFGNKTQFSNGNEHYDDRFVRKYKLTKRELQVLQLISQALSNKEIAKELFISDQTVSVHRKNIMKKLKVSNTAGLIKVAYEHSLIF